MWKFNPIYKETIWGGNKISAFKGDSAIAGNIGESWEICDLEGWRTRVCSGVDHGFTIQDLIAKYGDRVLGKRITSLYNGKFPLLVKFIDAQKDLSVQVHPTDEAAIEDGFENGKNEMWYIISSDNDSTIACGFNQATDVETFKKLVSENSLASRLNYIGVNQKDVFYIPAGRVHSIGKGIFLVEIQQSSDITYRIYDYDRIDRNGKKRDLHLDKAIRTINFNDTSGSGIDYAEETGLPINLVKSQSFSVNIWHIDEDTMRDYSEFDTFAVIVVIEGEATFETGDQKLNVKAGDTILLPSDIKGLSINPCNDLTLLEAYIK